MIRQAAWSAEAEAMLERAAERGTVGGLQSARELCAHSRLYAVELEGEGVPVAFYALELIEHSRGVEGVIVAAAGALAGVSLTRAVLPVIEAQLAGCDAVTVHTRRRALALELARRGYGFDGFILRKRTPRATQ